MSNQTGSKPQTKSAGQACIPKAFGLLTLVVALAASGCVHTREGKRIPGPVGSSPASDSGDAQADATTLDERMLAKADEALAAFSAVQKLDSSGPVRLDGSSSMFAVREGVGFRLCQYEAVIGTSDHGDAGNRVIIALAEPPVATSDERRYLFALPSYERADIGACDIVVTPAARGSELWLVFVTEPRSSPTP
jgi:hypothetical protein